MVELSLHFKYQIIREKNMLPDAVKEGSILVVDDEVMNLDIIREIFEGAGIEKYKSTTDPYEAIELFRNEEFDLVLLDMLMPKMNGKEVAENFQKVRPDHNVPVLVLTAVADKKVARYMLSDGGAKDYLTKPFDEYELVARIKNLLEVRMSQKNLELKVKERTKEQWLTQVALIQALGHSAEFRDNETGAHILRIGLISQCIAQEIGWSEKKSNMLRITAPLHDLGKVGIPDHILLKEGPLDAGERKVIETHTVIGFNILNNTGARNSTLIKMAKNIALNHHEKWDGKGGYPRKIFGEEIPPEARIVAVSDVFDALLSKRPYKEPWAEDKALHYIRSNSGKQFEPAIVSAFLHAYPRIVELRAEYSDDKMKDMKWRSTMASLDDGHQAMGMYL